MNCVSSLLSTHYSAFLFTGPFDLAKAHGAFNSAQKSIWAPIFYLVRKKVKIKMYTF